jgi:hypothetical protein
VLGGSFPAVAAKLPETTAQVAAAIVACDDHGHVSHASPFDTPGIDGSAPPVVELDPVDLERESSAAAAEVTATEIPLWLHVITEAGAGDVADDRLDAQLAVLNASFAGVTGTGAPSPFSFVNAGTTRTENPAWSGTEFSPHSEGELAAKSALRVGDAKTINVYVTATAAGNSWATFPQNYARNQSYDGIVVDNRSFLGGTNIGSNEGDVAVHEAGHWMGLFHTFQGGCTDGDLVADTPAEAVPPAGDVTRYCNPLSDTCTSPGSDPIHNFMNYTTDGCKNHFTAGQVERMKNQWAAYRLATPTTKPGKGGGKGGGGTKH